MEENEQQPQNQELVIKMIWIAFQVAVLLYAVVLYTQVGAPPELDFNQILDFENPQFVMYFGMGLTAFFGQFFVSNLMQNRDNPKQAVFMNFIIRSVLLEMTALFGFVMGFMTQNFALSLPLFALALIGFQFNNPMRRLEGPRRI